MSDISSPSSSCLSIPSSRASSPRTNLPLRRQKRNLKNATATYTLRPRDHNANEASVSVVRHRRPERLQEWQNSTLQEVFDAGIRSPGDATIMLLVIQLKDRTEKQIRDWFSHRRRRLRETGVVDKLTPQDEDIPIVIESLILSRFERDYGKLEQLAGSGQVL